MKLTRKQIDEIEGEVVAVKEYVELAQAKIVALKSMLKEAGQVDGFYDINQIQIALDKAKENAKKYLGVRS